MRRAMMILLATSGVARAGTELIPDEKTLDALLKNEKLVKRFATVGSPRADEIEPGATCKGELTGIKLGFDPYRQKLEDAHYDVALEATQLLRYDDSKLGVQMIVAPTVEMFDDPTFTPIGVDVAASTNSDGTNTARLRIFTLGYQVDVLDVTQGADVSYVRSFGYQLPVARSLTANQLGVDFSSGASPNYPYFPYATWSASATGTTHAGGLVTLQAGSTGVQARALLSAYSFADIALTIGMAYCDKPGCWKPLYQASGRLDVIRFLFGGRTQLLPQLDGRWLADADASTSVTDAMGMDFGFLADQQEHPYLVQLELLPLDYVKDSAYACTVEPKFTPKAHPKVSTKP